MIKAVIKLDTQYWVLIDIPKQEKQEPAATYVMRCCAIIEKSADSRLDGKSAETKKQEEEERQRERQRLNGEPLLLRYCCSYCCSFCCLINSTCCVQCSPEMSIPEIAEENNEATNDLHRLLKKYNNGKWWRVMWRSMDVPWMFAVEQCAIRCTNWKWPIWTRNCIRSCRVTSCWKVRRTINVMF